MDISQPIRSTEAFVRTLWTSELLVRPHRAPDYALENHALVELAKTLSSTPREVLNVLVSEALRLCSAGSAGISILESTGASGTHFRWQALAGEWTPYLGEVLPRSYSPCGVVLDNNAAQLMGDLASYYDYVKDIKPACHEVLLVPFSSNGVPVGTIWVVHHDPDATFDAEDQRRLTSLAAFASAAYEALKNLEKLGEHAEARSREVTALADADRSKDVLIATIAHELRNPLNPIRTSVTLLHRAETQPAVRARAIEIIERQVTKMARLVDDLLDVSRVRLGHLEMKPQVLNLVEVIKAAVEANPTSRHTIRTQLPSEPVLVSGDLMRLTQVVENLLGNAVKYTDENGTIDIQLTVVDRQAVTTIKDSGIGIAADQIEAVFGLFAQAGQAGSARSQGGLGIGLHLARHLVESHQGTLTVESLGTGRGSTFCVRLPLATRNVSPVN